MTLTVNISDGEILAKLGDFLTSILPDGTLAVVGQVNRVAEPGVPNFVVMTPTRRTRQATNWIEPRIDLEAQAYTQPTTYDVQLDFHGPEGADNAQIVETVWRSETAVDALELLLPGLAPLYADDARQMPFINGEDQYEDRWSLTVTLQANITVSTAQQFADTLTLDVVEIDATYPPGA